MKKIALIALLFSLLGINAQAQDKFYTSSGGEMIFSFANIDNNGVAGSNIVRWTPWFNVQFYGNYDFNNHFGLIFGAAIRNVGFIYDNAPNLNNIGSDEYENDNIKYKFRNYDFGVPVGIKLGILDKVFLFGGYEIEFPFWFKQKTFINDVKQDEKISIWFTSRTPAYYNTFFAGIQFPYGFSVKFKYYTSGFFNENYTEIQNGVSVQPYKGLKANMWYFSLCFSLFDRGKWEY
jgi:hypothetical protein